MNVVWTVGVVVTIYQLFVDVVVVPAVYDNVNVKHDLAELVLIIPPAKGE